MNKIEVLKIINKDIYTLGKAWGTLFHNKTYAVITGDRVEKFFKTKRGAEGYIKKNKGFSYYDDYFQELVSPHKNDFVVEILDNELTDLSTNKELWYNYLKSNIQNIFAYHMGENIVYTAKHANVTAELLDYIETTVKDIETTESMTVIEEFAEDKVIEDIKNEIESKQGKEIHKDEDKTEIKPVSEAIQQVNNTTNDNIEVRYNTYKNGIEVLFADKPSSEVLAQLKANGFRWSKYQKLWYTKDTQERRNFIKEVLQANIESSEGNIITESEKVIDYPSIDINDIDTYVISIELSKRENNVAMFRNKERDHQQELRDLLQSWNDKIIDALKNTDNEEIIYNTKRKLQSIKKRYYNIYVRTLNHKANNPSWAVTGRGGLNVNRYNKKLSQYDNMLKELVSISNEFDELLNGISWKIQKEQNKRTINKYLNDIKDIDITGIKFEKKTIKINMGAVSNIFDNPTREVNAYCYNGYYIIKTWGRFRIYNKQGNEVEQTVHTGTLKNAKENLIFMLNSVQNNNIQVAEG